jgi:hypothetical protein
MLPADIDIDGLDVLSERLAVTCIKAIGIQSDKSTQSKVKDAITKTLIQEWGAKSYEFILEKNATEYENKEKLFRSHCYFGKNNETRGEDSFPHFKCYADYGNSVGTLDFLLEELKLLSK